MKQLSILLMAVLLTMCGGNVGKKAPLQAPSDPIAESVPEIDYEALNALVDAAPATLAKDILGQLPPGYLPGGKEIVDQMIKSSSGEYPYSFDWFEFEGECDVTGIEIHMLPCLDGSWLVTCVTGSGCDCYVQDPPTAFRYRDGILSETQWPLDEPEYEDFASPLVEHLMHGEELTWVKEYWSISYSYDYQNPYLLRAVFNDIDHWEFSEACRPINFYWDGEKFLRHDGRYNLVGYEGSSFAGFRPGEELGEAPEGYAFEEEDGFTWLKDLSSGNRVARFLVDPEEGIEEITALSPEFSRSWLFWPGQPISNALSVMEATPEDTPACLHGDDEVVLLINDYFRMLVAVADIEGTPGEDGVYSEWSYNPEGRLLGLLVVPVEEGE